MHEQSLLCINPSISKRNSTIFLHPNKKIILKAPFKLTNELIGLCDGIKSYCEIVDILSKSWDKNRVIEFIDDLLKNEIIVWSNNISKIVWKYIENPSIYETNDDKISAQKMAQDARIREFEHDFKCNYFPSSSKLQSLLKKRKSTRAFSNLPVSKQSVINLIWSAYAGYHIKDGDFVHKTVPSAGALFPLAIHVAIFNELEDITSGLYRVFYNKQGGIGLKLISENIFQFARAFLDPLGITEGIQGVVVISGSFNTSEIKYGNRSLLYVSLEAGHSAQNIHLQCIEEGIESLEIGGFIDPLLSKSLDLPNDFYPLTTVAFGHEDINHDNTEDNIEIEWAVPVSDEYSPPFSMASVRLSNKRNWSHGRNESPKIAFEKAKSEAIEWTACGCIPPDLIEAKYLELENIVKPEDIIKYNPAQYRISNFPFKPFNQDINYAWTTGYNYFSDQNVYILADHVYFPYFPNTPYYTFANSSGCAAHPNHQKAIELSILELIERDSFMNAYLSKLVLPSVNIQSIPSKIRNRIKTLQNMGWKIIIKDHSLDLAPVISIIVQNDSLHFTACASCCSFDLEYALSHSLTEVEASILFRLQNGVPKKINPKNVIFPLDHGRLYAQKQYYKNANFLINHNQIIDFCQIGNRVSHCFNKLLDYCIEINLQIFIVPLKLSENYNIKHNLNIVRAIIPGLIPMTFGYRQEPADMKRIYDISHKFGRLIKYNELSKFPHPFE